MASDTATAMSSKADRNRHFFLELPAELRNEVYAMLYISTDPIRIAVTSIHGDYDEAQLDRLTTPFEPSINFLLSCSQVYEEATSILYAKNSVAIGPLELDFCWVCGLSISKYISNGVEWLRQLSPINLRRLLPLVAFELDGICSHSRSSYHSRRSRHDEFPTADLIDVTRLAKLLWETVPHLEAKFTRPVNSYHRTISLQSESWATKAVTAIVRELGGGALRLHRVAPFIREVRIERSGRGILVKYRYPPNLCIYRPERILYAYYDNENDTVVLEQNVRLATLLSLPEDLRKRIYEQVLSPHRGYPINLDGPSNLKNNTALLKVCNTIWIDMRRMLHGNGRFTLELTSYRERTSFGGFLYLRNFLCARGTKGVTFRGWLFKAYGSNLTINIRLNFSFQRKVPLNMLQIEIVDFLLVTSHLEDASVAVVSWSGPPGRESIIDSNTITLTHLRRNVYYFLRDTTWPETHMYRCPQIFVDCHGTVAESDPLMFPQLHVRIGSLGGYLQALAAGLYESADKAATMYFTQIDFLAMA